MVELGVIRLVRDGGPLARTVVMEVLEGLRRSYRTVEARSTVALVGVLVTGVRRACSDGNVARGGGAAGKVRLLSRPIVRGMGEGEGLSRSTVCSVR